MNKTRKTYLALAVGLGLGPVAGRAADANLILNSGFEQPFETGRWESLEKSKPHRWMGRIDTDEIARSDNGRSGGFCMRAAMERSGGVIYLVPDVAVGECHRLEFFAMTEEGQITVRAEGGIPSYQRISGPEWQKVSIIFRAETERVAVWLVPIKRAAILRIDDVSLTKIPWPLARGKVFDDVNGNGTLDRDEKGIPGVQVNAATAATQTDDDGAYEINVIPGKFVFVTKPAGWRLVKGFFERLPDSMSETPTINFPLAADPTEPEDDFSFLTYNDMHLHLPIPVKEHKRDSSTSPADVEEGIKALNRMYPEPLFVVDVGDMVDQGTDEMFSAYVERLAQHKYTIWPVAGNHEKMREGPSDFANFEKWVGPLYYSFDYGRYHFVAIFFGGDARQATWLKRDSELNSDKPKILFSHYLGSWGTFDRLSKIPGALAVFTGHWHTEYAFHFGEMAHFSSASFVRAGGGASPASFRHVTLNGDRIRTTQRVLSVENLLKLVFPANGSVVASGKIALKVNAYDAGSLIDRVSCAIDGGPSLPLSPLNDWTWTAAVDLAPGQHDLALTAAAGDRRWTAGATVTVSADDLPQPRMGTPWPTFQGDSMRSGKAKEAVRPPLRLAWVANTGGRISLSSPVVYRDKVYIGVSDTANFEHSGVRALEVASGRLVWKTHTDAPIRHTVAAAGDKAFGLTSTGKIVALAAGNGKALWSYDLPAFFERKIQIPVLVHNGVLAGGTAREFVALEAESGARLWSHSTVKRKGDVSYAYKAPAADGDMLLACITPGPSPLLAWELRSGKPIWAAEAHAVRYTSPVTLTATRMLVSDAGGKLYLVDRATGDEVGTLKAGALYSAPIVDGTTLIACDNNSGAVRALDLETGGEIWRFQTGEAVAPLALHKIRGSSMMSSPVLSGGVVYVGSDDGWFYALDAKDGSRLWAHEIGVPIASSAAVSGNAVFVAALDGNVYAFVTK